MYSNYCREDKEKLLSKLLFRIPRIQQLFLNENIIEDKQYIDIPKSLKYRGSIAESMIKLIERVFDK